MKEGTRLYINLTNKCNTACPFCCMYSDPSKNTFMTFDIFRSIIDDCKTDFELQLEGGEPLLHKDINEFIDIASKDFYINMNADLKKNRSSHLWREKGCRYGYP